MYAVKGYGRTYRRCTVSRRMGRYGTSRETLGDGGEESMVDCQKCGEWVREWWVVQGRRERRGYRLRDRGGLCLVWAMLGVEEGEQTEHSRSKRERGTWMMKTPAWGDVGYCHRHRAMTPYKPRIELAETEQAVDGTTRSSRQ